MKKLLIILLTLGCLTVFANDSTCKNDIVVNGQSVEINSYSWEYEFKNCMAYALVDLRDYQSRAKFSADSLSAKVKVSLPLDQRIKDEAREEKRGSFIKEPTVIEILSPKL